MPGVRGKIPNWLVLLIKATTEAGLLSQKDDYGQTVLFLLAEKNRELAFRYVARIATKEDLEDFLTHHNMPKTVFEKVVKRELNKRFPADQ
jgi:hypothetical protein